MRNRIVAAVAALSLLVTGTALAGTQISSAPGAGQTRVVHTLCVGIQGGNGVSRYDLSLSHNGLGTICIQGKRGRVGGVGPKGPRGFAGAPGQDGVDGVDGTNGRDGKDGARGPAGPQGAPGQDGADGTITGTVPVCASPGGNLKVCGGDQGHDEIIGYLALTS